MQSEPKIYELSECGTLRRLERRMIQDIHGLFAKCFVDRFPDHPLFLVDTANYRFAVRICLFFECFVVNAYAALKGKGENDAI